MTINDRIVLLIKNNKNFTQKELAASIGVASSTINNWLKLGRSIPAEYIIPISEFLGVSCNYLLDGEDAKPGSSCSPEDAEWLTLIHQLPPEAQYEFRGEIKGYLKRLNEESVAADKPLKKTGTDKPGK